MACRKEEMTTFKNKVPIIKAWHPVVFEKLYLDPKSSFCSALLFPVRQPKLVYPSMCSLLSSKIPGEWERGSRPSISFLCEIIHLTGGTRLANTQVAVICSKCVILASVAVFLGSATSSHAARRSLLSFSLCPPWALSWGFDSEPARLRWWRIAPTSTMLS